MKDFIFQFPPTGVDKVIRDDHVALGGSVSANIKANEAYVTEHSFLPLQTDEEVVLFDNTGQATADHQLVVFSDPMHDLTVSGSLTTDEEHVNYAVVSGVGVLTGKRYTHTRLIVTASSAEEGDAIRSKSVNDNCLINEANSQNAARRVLSYYAVESKFKSKIMMTDEKPGDMVRIKNPFRDVCEAHVEKMDILATSVIGASMELTEGFNAQWVGNNFSHSDLITQSQTWTVPAGVTQIRVVLIGGGQGGQGGSYGHVGAGYWFSDDPTAPKEFFEMPVLACAYDEQPVFEGGDAGGAGTGGKILSFNLDVTPGDTLTFTIGSGGVGGAKGAAGYNRYHLSIPGYEYGPPGAVGALGGDTKAVYSGNTFNSANGAISPTGYLDLFRNAVYGLPGEAGHKGGAGGQTNVQSLNGWQYAAGLPGQDVGQWTGGAGGNGISAKWWTGGPEDQNSYNVASGGGGGGAAWGANGKATHYRAHPEATFDNSPEFYNGSNYSVRAAFGGDGADAVKPTTPTYGCGGGGGNGGGSGGNAGGGRISNHFSEDASAEPRIAIQSGGNAGSGSDGGDGGAGCAIVYY